MRAFFEGQGYLEVQTPVRVITPAMEDHIEAEQSGDHWLRTSPELHMKRMVAAGYKKIFQIGPCFRQGERGQRHLPEYTMLEWYWTGASYADLIPQTLDLIRACAQAMETPFPAGLESEPLIVTVADLFLKVADWNPVDGFDADRFDLDLVEKVEPWIGQQERPVVLKDFPIERAALARISPVNPSVAERWELYLGGIEIANAYSELTDAQEQRTRFEACAALRTREEREVYPLDESFLEALKTGMPDCAGIAVGVDRLLMYLLGADGITKVVAFPD